MLAFQSDPFLKEFLLKRMRAHNEAGEITKEGPYWDGKRGRPLPCMLNRNAPEDYELETGIPLILAQVAERIFMGLSPGGGAYFALAFISEIKPGQDLSGVARQYLRWYHKNMTLSAGKLAGKLFKLILAASKTKAMNLKAKTIRLNDLAKDLKYCRKSLKTACCWHKEEYLEFQIALLLKERRRLQRLKVSTGRAA